ncbi:Cro/CI family transcriptional regulator [Variovorax paradoxus]|uniref:Cro/CI family transcriptional regulator n=1 Tax=Variovorax paradoxus TaxID=34073 RepID=UPI0029C6CBDE|nr:Cro/CI family transcriptional regulator [Variovorax paradoxus]WPH22287.1 Cro/CI family transcriptional regulator [Variovorax paradoxus]
MKKTEAIELLGGSVTAAAAAIGVSYQAVNQWPEDLPARIEDRVLAALARQRGLVASIRASKRKLKEAA